MVTDVYVTFTRALC